MKRLIGLIPLLLFLLVVAAFGCFRVIDTDIWLYIRTGEYICQNLSVPRTDIFSYTAAGQPWIDVHWLAQVVLYITDAVSGPVGLSILRLAVVIAIFSVLYRCCRLKARPLTTIVVLTIAVLTANDRFLIKPSLFALLLATLSIFLLERSRRYAERSVYLLVPLQIIWTNMHPSFFLGPLLVLIYLLDAVVKPAGETIGRRKRLALVFALVILSCLLNPYGFTMLLQPWRQMGSGIFIENIIPWKAYTASFPSPYSLLFFKAMLGACLIALLLNARKIRLAHLIIVVIFGILGLRSQRMITIFALLSAPGLAYNIASVTAKLRNRWPTAVRFSRGVALVLISLVLALLLTELISSSYYIRQRSLRRFGLGKSRIAFPEEAFAFIDSGNIEGNTFCNYDMGSCFAGHFYPRRKVFIDGRNLVYGEEIFKTYLDAIGDVEYMDKLADKYDISSIILTHGARDAKAVMPDLWKSTRWRPVYIDDRAVVFLRDMAEPAIQRVDIDSCRLKGVPSTTKFPLAELRAGEFYFGLGRDRCAKQNFLQALERFPSLPEAYNFLGIVAMREGKLSAAKEDFLEASRINPSYAEPHINLSTLLLREGELDGAEYQAKFAVRLDPSNARVHGCLGIVYLRQGKFPQATREFQTAIKLDPQDPEYHNNLGSLYEVSGDLNKAIAQYEKARAMKKDYFAPRFNLGRLYTRADNIGVAIEIYREAIAIMPDHEGAKKNLSVLLTESGKQD